MRFDRTVHTKKKVLISRVHEIEATPASTSKFQAIKKGPLANKISLLTEKKPYRWFAGDSTLCDQAICDQPHTRATTHLGTQHLQIRYDRAQDEFCKGLEMTAEDWWNKKQHHLTKI